MFFGREEYLRDLEALYSKSVASLVTCRGRRRIGKSTLIEEFAKRVGARFIRLEGIKPQPSLSNEDELKAFADQLAVQTKRSVRHFSSWTEAFVRLDAAIPRSGRTVVLIDEVSWFAHYDKTFADVVKVCWDGYWKKHKGLIVVICGSVSSWIKDNIVDNGAFLGRRSLDIVVRELPLNECVRFWGNKVERTSIREMIDVLAVTGGVPRYLEEISPSCSAAENIRRLCFTPNGVLRSDFDQMFNDVITQQPNFTSKVLRCLVDGSRTVTEVSTMLKLEKGGRVSDALNRLAEAGMVSADAGKNPETGKNVREQRFRLKDNYARFYIKYIEPVKKMIDDRRYSFKMLETLDNWDSVMGLQFENMVVNNYGSLIPHLHLSDVLLTSSAPYRKSPVPSKRQKGCQIDLLIQSRRTIYVVEVKRKNEIGREVIAEVDEKVRRLKRPQNVSVKTALVYEGHLAPIVEADGYFDALIPFSRLLGL
ncbi:MAG: AAA family ATPase [Kiritimatiellae bacterium]|nr:AAA family ATPase [Kiritimatiellia bacterium]